MAAKGPTAGVAAKRKPSSTKNDGGAKAKKARLETPRKSRTYEEEEMESTGYDGISANSSDSEDGGAKLEPADRIKGTNRKLASDKSDHGEANSKIFERGQNSRDTHQKQKQLAQERKAAKPLADELHRTKKIWEKLRRKSHVAKEERQELVNELYGIITGRIKDFVLKHDAVRAVQTAIKYSTPEQRKQIARELQGAYATLAESKYAKFLIGKLLVQNDSEIRDIIVPEFNGKVRRLINHPEASWILDDIYRGAATREQKAMILREWYGPEFFLFRDDKEDKGNFGVDLAAILGDAPSKRGSVMQYLFSMINQLIQKKLTGFTMLHDAMLQYFLALEPNTEEMKGFVDVIKDDENGDLLKNMAFTQSGARLVCLLLAHGTAKERRQILKTFKDTFQLMSGDPYGHVVILTAYDVVDDTVMVSKTIFPEILGAPGDEVQNIIICANNLNARTTICYPFEGPSKSLFPPSHAADLEILRQVNEIRKTTSKKNPETRRQELIAALSPQLLSTIAAAPFDLISTSFGCQFATDILLNAVGDKAPALEAIASAAAGEPGSGGSDDSYPHPKQHISLTAHGGKMLKALIAGGRFDRDTGKVKPVEPPLRFADIFYPVIRDHIVAWATGPSSFAVLGLLEARDFSSLDDLRSRLSKNKQALRKSAYEETAEQQARRVELAGKSGSKEGAKNKKAQSKEAPVGNLGARLLLEKLDKKVE